MTIDFIDQAFLRRLAEPLVASGVAATVSPVEAMPHLTRPQPASSGDPIVARLLTTCPEQWERLADRLEATFESGNRVVAVVGRSRGDGCSTIVRGLAHVLQARGVSVTCHVRGRASASAADLSDEQGGPALVDAGIWFPSGPMHRGRLARAAIGCHAALLVRRAERQPCPAHAHALAALGIHVLGEVVTFAHGEHSDTPSA